MLVVHLVTSDLHDTFSFLTNLKMLSVFDRALRSVQMQSNNDITEFASSPGVKSGQFGIIAKFKITRKTAASRPARP